MRSEKEPILKAQGYVYNFDRMVYYNRAEKKAFSAEWVEDHTPEELSQALRERNGVNDWHFYLNDQPSGSVKDAFIAEVNG